MAEVCVMIFPGYDARLNLIWSQGCGVATSFSSIPVMHIALFGCYLLWASFAQPTHLYTCK